MNFRDILAVAFAQNSGVMDVEMVVSPYNGAVSGTWLVGATSVTRNGSAAGQASVDLDRAVVSGASYRVRFTVADKTGDDFFYRLGGGGTAHQITGNGSHDAVVSGGGTSSGIAFAPWGGAAGEATITSLSVQRLNSISFVGSKAGFHAETSGQAVSLADLLDTAGAAATLIEGDLVFINLVQTYNASRTEAQMLCTGFTAVFTPPLYSNDGNDTELLAQYKIMGATPDTTVTIPASDSTNRGVAYTIHAFRGASLSTPIDVAATTATGVDNGTANAPAITPTTAGAWILACAGAGQTASTAHTNPSGMDTTTNYFRATVNGAGPVVKAAAATAVYTGWTSGAYDPAVFGGGGVNANDSWASATVALRPAA